MNLDENGIYVPVLGAREKDKSLSKYCPQLMPELNEDVLSDLFLKNNPKHDYRLGKFVDIHAIHVAEGDYRRLGSSGGMGSWLACELLGLGLIDGVIHSRPISRSSKESPFFSYGISRSIDELRAAAHSHYHVVHMSEVLHQVKEAPGRYLFVGVPCMVKAVRRLQLADSVFKERIPITMALICGHLKSVHWALSLGWGKGINPDCMRGINFRVKSDNIPARSYYFSVTQLQEGSIQIFNAADVVGGLYNLGAMMPKACEFCDDVVGETADITIGDAWLPRYAFDWRGKNMVISRNEELSNLIRQAAVAGRLSVERLKVSEAVDAQSGGFRQRREGLAHRLAKAQAAGEWWPVKRNLPDMNLPGKLRRLIYDLRSECSARSFVAFRNALDAGDYSLYENEMLPLFRRLRRIEVIAALLRILRIRIQAFLAAGKR